MENLLTKKDYNDFRNQLDDMQIEIHKDIVETGIVEMLNMVSKIADYQNRIDGIRGEVEWNKVILRNLKESLEQKYEAKEERYLTEDDEVKKQSSNELRYAKAHNKKDMKKLKEKLDKVKRKYNKAKALANIVKNKYEFLEGVYAKISRQLSGVKQAWLMGDISFEEVEKMIQEVVEGKGKITKGGEEI